MSNARHRILFLACAFVFAVPLGCVERELFIRTEPPGASVCLDGRDLGLSPVSAQFYYYGDRLLELRLRGHKPEQTIISLKTPWYQYFPMDLFSDLFWPGTITDDHHLVCELEAAREGLEEKPAILERADELRYGSFIGSPHR